MGTSSLDKMSWNLSGRHTLYDHGTRYRLPVSFQGPFVFLSYFLKGFLWGVAKNSVSHQVANS